MHSHSRHRLSLLADLRTAREKINGCVISLSGVFLHGRFWSFVALISRDDLLRLPVEWPNRIVAPFFVVVEHALLYADRLFACQLRRTTW